MSLCLQYLLNIQYLPRFQHTTLSDIFNQVIANFQEILHLNFKLSCLELGLYVSWVSDILFI